MAHSFPADIHQQEVLRIGARGLFQRTCRDCCTRRSDDDSTRNMKFSIKIKACTCSCMANAVLRQNRRSQPIVAQARTSAISIILKCKAKHLWICRQISFDLAKQLIATPYITLWRSILIRPRPIRTLDRLAVFARRLETRYDRTKY